MDLNHEANLPNRVSVGTSLKNVSSPAETVTALTSSEKDRRLRGYAGLPPPEGAAGSAQASRPLALPALPPRRAVLLPGVPEVEALKSASLPGLRLAAVGHRVPWAACGEFVAARETDPPGGSEAALTWPLQTRPARRGPSAPGPERQSNE